MTTEEGMSRRDFVKTAFAVTAVTAGFAASVLPVGAQTIHTDSKGLVAGEVQVATSDGTIPAYRAMPDKHGPFPIILVVHEIFGVHEHIQDVCRRLAKHGYLAIAPALFAREGDVTKLTDMKAVMSIVSTVPDLQVMSDLDATVAWCVTSADGNSAKLGITGFCWGGRIVWLYAAHSDSLKAAVAWYGPLVRPTNALQPANPVDVAGQLKIPVLGLYGGQDTNITADNIAQMRKALAQANSKSQIVVYPDAPHGFHADYRPSYRAADAKDGERRMYDWFRRAGVD